MTSWFQVTASARPQMLLRALGIFAQRDLVPRHITVHQVGDDLQIIIDVDGLTDQAAQLLCRKLEQIVAVKHAHWTASTKLVALSNLCLVSSLELEAHA